MTVLRSCLRNLGSHWAAWSASLFEAGLNAGLVLQVLQLRIEAMLAGGRPVVLVGDLNMAPHMIDHCDWSGRASQPSAQVQFLKHRPDREWFQSVLATDGGPLTDIFRKFHPNRSVRDCNHNHNCHDAMYDNHRSYLRAFNPS